MVARRPRNDEVKVSGPEYAGQRPIAVVDKYGFIHPMPATLLLDAYIPESDVTFVYKQEDLKALKAHNEKLIEQRDFDRAVSGQDFFSPSQHPDKGFDRYEVQGATFGGTKLKDTIELDLSR